MSKKSVNKYIVGLAFDIDGKPELAEAIFSRLRRLDPEMYTSPMQSGAKSILVERTGFYHEAAPVVHSCDEWGYKLAILSDLYDIPAEKHTISIDGGKEIELSNKSYKNLTEAMK